MIVPSILKSNTVISNLISDYKTRFFPFIVSRLGLGVESILMHEYEQTGEVSIQSIQKYNISNNAGIYCKTGDDVNKFCELSNACLKNSDAFACFSLDPKHYIYPIQCKFANDNVIHSRSLEPFFIYHFGLENETTPWTHQLEGLNVLVINPFVESMKKQMNNGFEMFGPDKPIFKKGQEFSWYKTFQTHGGNHPHSNWIETFEIMCNDIKQIEFDVALLGCGGYGLPLCNFIKEEMGKSAIYVGGGLQLLFGIMGKRWECHEVVKNIIETYNPSFVRPSEEETNVINISKVENGCYW